MRLLKPDAEFNLDNTTHGGEPSSERLTVPGEMKTLFLSDSGAFLEQICDRHARNRLNREEFTESVNKPIAIRSEFRLGLFEPAEHFQPGAGLSYGGKDALAKASKISHAEGQSFGGVFGQNVGNSCDLAQ
jgi:hypothetical protein